MSEKFTKGPWRVGGIGNNPKKADLVVYDRRGLEVAQCHPHPGEHFESSRMADAKANARLIAQAPEMYGLLKEFEWSWWKRSTAKEACPMCRNTKDKGHAHDCRLNAVLQAVGGE